MASPPRSRPSARVAFLLGIALTAGSGVAQQRTAAGGRVLGPDGSAVARATVTFVGCEAQVASRWNPQHIRQTHAAADGTFELRFVAVPGATFVGRADLVTRSARFALTPGANGPIELKAP